MMMEKNEKEQEVVEVEVKGKDLNRQSYWHLYVPWQKKKKKEEGRKCSFFVFAAGCFNDKNFNIQFEISTKLYSQK